MCCSLAGRPVGGSHKRGAQLGRVVVGRWQKRQHSVQVHLHGARCTLHLHGVPAPAPAARRTLHVQDIFAGDNRGEPEDYIQQLWRAVPLHSRALTAIYCLPQLGHRRPALVKNEAWIGV